MSVPETIPMPHVYNVRTRFQFPEGEGLRTLRVVLLDPELGDVEAGCRALSAVQFPQFNIYKDLTQGGAEIDLGKLQPGQYQFACGMNMNFGLLVVR